MENKSGNKRSTSFTASEENLLIHLAKKYGKQIECAKSDTNTNKIKSEAWAQIEIEFNSHALEKNRDVNVLRNKYNNIKKRSKKKIAEEKKSLYKTGGGKGIQTVDSEIDSDIRKLLGSQMTGLESIYDDDYGPEPENAEGEEGVIIQLKEFAVVPELPNYGAICSNVQQILVNQEGAEADVKAETTVLDWAKNTPDMLKTPISKQLARNKKSEVVAAKSGGKGDALKTNMGKWASAKKELVELQKKCFLEEKLPSFS